jgi:hypothetical protein
MQDQNQVVLEGSRAQLEEQQSCLNVHYNGKDLNDDLDNNPNLHHFL